MIKKGVTKVRQSKYRHLFGTPAQSSECIGSVKLGSVQMDANPIKANAQYMAVPWAVTGTVAIIPLTQKGAVHPELPLIIHEEKTVNDLQFNPFHNDLLATACSDGSVALWKIPEGGLTDNLTNPEREIKVSDKRVMTVGFHPLASQVMWTADAGKTIKLWDLETSQEKLVLPEVHKAAVTSLSWNKDGSQLVTSAKDKFLRIFDPRANKVVAETEDHPGAKGSQNVWCNGTKEFIFTAGFGKGSDRQLALYDPRKLNDRLTLQPIDASSSTLLPFFDHDNNVLFLAGKGDGNIRYYEIADDEPYVHYLNEFKSKDPQSGIAMLPKQSVDVMKCEIARFVKITPGGTIVPLRFEVPRQDNMYFQEDLFPDTFDGQPSMTSEAWFGGANTPGNLMSLDPQKKK